MAGRHIADEILRNAIEAAVSDGSLPDAFSGARPCSHPVDYDSQTDRQMRAESPFSYQFQGSLLNAGAPGRRMVHGVPSAKAARTIVEHVNWESDAPVSRVSIKNNDIWVELSCGGWRNIVKAAASNGACPQPGRGKASVSAGLLDACEPVGLTSIYQATVARFISGMLRAAGFDVPPVTLEVAAFTPASRNLISEVAAKARQLHSSAPGDGSDSGASPGARPSRSDELAAIVEAGVSGVASPARWDAEAENTVLSSAAAAAMVPLRKFCSDIEGRPLARLHGGTFPVVRVLRHSFPDGVARLEERIAGRGGGGTFLLEDIYGNPTRFVAEVGRVAMACDENVTAVLVEKASAAEELDAALHASSERKHRGFMGTCCDLDALDDETSSVLYGMDAPELAYLLLTAGNPAVDLAEGKDGMDPAGELQRMSAVCNSLSGLISSQDISPDAVMEMPEDLEDGVELASKVDELDRIVSAAASEKLDLLGMAKLCSKLVDMSEKIHARLSSSGPGASVPGELVMASVALEMLDLCMRILGLSEDWAARL